MQLVDILNQVGGVQALARELGVTESQTASGAAALLPAILILGMTSKMMR